MTLNNAKRRFDALGCAVERAEFPYRYKWRPLESLGKWRNGSCLYAMLEAAERELKAIQLRKAS